MVQGSSPANFLFVYLGGRSGRWNGRLVKAAPGDATLKVRTVVDLVVSGTEVVAAVRGGGGVRGTKVWAGVG